MAANTPSWARLTALAYIVALPLASRSAHAEYYDWGEHADVFGCVTRCTSQEARTLAGHTFVPSTLIDWAFITSSVGSASTAGSGEFDIPPGRLASALEIENEDFVYAEQTILVRAALTRWLAIAVQGQGAGIVPRTRLGAIFVGAHVVYGGNGIATLRLFRTERFQASVLGDFSWLRADNIVPARLPRSPFVTGDIKSIRPAVAIAWAPHWRLGLQGSASFSWRWFDLVDEDRIETLAAGGALTLDLDPVPFTVLLAGQWQHDYDRDTETSTITSNAVFATTNSRAWGEAGLVYRGRRELDVGAAFLAKIIDTDEESRWLGQFFINYYF